MKNISSTGGKIFFETTKEALSNLHIEQNEDDVFSTLVWFDTIKDQDYFSFLAPWQIVNRIPNINVICKKASFVRCIQRIAIFFPDLFHFLPRSFILPLHKMQFTQLLSKTKKTYIIKPDGGALGSGIVILPPGSIYPLNSHLSIAQEYIESFLLNGYKFDLRIYVLVIASKTPKIYVYRDGIARFCSSPANENTQFSQLTNTAVNRKNPEANISSCTRTIKEVFKLLQKYHNVDINKLWTQIDDAIGLTVLSSTGIVNFGMSCKTRETGIPRAFQLLGFDVLLDQNIKPWILEVNYRPSLDFDTDAERKLKVKMLKELLSIAVVPYSELEAIVREKNRAAWSPSSYRRFISKNDQMINRAKKKRKDFLKQSDFVKIFPTKDERRAVWKDVLRVSEELPAESRNDYQLPRIVDYVRSSVPQKLRKNNNISKLPQLQKNRLYPA